MLGVLDSMTFEVAMEGTNWVLLFLVLSPYITEAWKAETRFPPEARRVHNHRKRHMAPPAEAADVKKHAATTELRKNRKKPSGHLTPLDEDDIDNDEVVSVAVGPPQIKLKYDKLSWKPRESQKGTAPATEQMKVNPGVINLVKDVLMQLGRDFLSRQVNEDFVFGQYVGNAMRSLSSDLKLKMQHDILELVVKYQKLNRNEPIKKPEEVILIRDKKALSNDTDDVWPDFTNLAKIVG